MSYAVGLDTIFLRPTPRLAHTEYCSNDALKRALHAGVDTRVGATGQAFSSGKKSPTLIEKPVKFEDAWELDFIWTTYEGQRPLGHRGRTTDMGHAVFLEEGVDYRLPKPCPFTDVQQVLEFDAVEEYGLQDFDALVDDLGSWHQKLQADYPNQVVPGGYYHTVVSGAIQAFGWDMLLEGAAYQDEFEKVLDSFFRLSLNTYKAWARTGISTFISHDDFVWSMGAFMAPAYYRRVILPRYAELWSVLKKAGKKVLFCSDANWIEFIDDIAAAGADGFIFEPMMPLEPVVKKYGQTHVIAGSKVDCRTLTFGTRAQIQAEVDATLELAWDCPGFMFAVGNHIPANVPLENAMFYFDYLRKNWTR